MTLKYFCRALGLTALVVFELAYHAVKRADDGAKKAADLGHRGVAPSDVQPTCPCCGHHLES
jgi:hypothetical protein